MTWYMARKGRKAHWHPNWGSTAALCGAYIGNAKVANESMRCSVCMKELEMVERVKTRVETADLASISLIQQMMLVKEARKDEERSRPRGAAQAILQRLEQYRLARLPKPRCCNTIREKERDGSEKWNVWLEVPYLEEDDFEPRWVNSTGIVVFFCAWCGTKLPAVEKNQHPPTPICTTDGYYCGQCGERNMGCSCWHPSAAYRCVWDRCGEDQ